MGLESHVNRVLEEAGIIRWLWTWENGLKVEDDTDAEIIMGVLDKSGEFGPARYNKLTQKIEFGAHKSFPEFYQAYYNDYDGYCKAFKKFKAD